MFIENIASRELFCVKISATIWFLHFLLETHIYYLFLTEQL